jgi:phosphoribosyl 1,2-cyclic phosphodiesterase
MSLTLRFWGTRGSIPTPGPSTVRYGGNTPCVEVRTGGGALGFLDAGTGIRQ